MEAGVLLELPVGVLGFVLLSVDLDAGGAEGKETVGVFAEVEDEFLAVEGAVFGPVDLFCHRIPIPINSNYR